MKKETRALVVFSIGYLLICFIMGLDRSLDGWLLLFGFVGWSGIMAFVYFGIRFHIIKI